MYKFLNCDKLLCPLCKNKYNKKDKIINIEKKMYIVRNIMNHLIIIVNYIRKIYA